MPSGKVAVNSCHASSESAWMSLMKLGKAVSCFIIRLPAAIVPSHAIDADPPSHSLVRHAGPRCRKHEFYFHDPVLPLAEREVSGATAPLLELDAVTAESCWSMMRKSGHHFFENIMLKLKEKPQHVIAEAIPLRRMML